MLTRMVCLAIAVVAGTPLQVPKAAMQVTQRARALTPGEVVLVTVRPSSPLTELRGEWAGETLVFYQSEGTRWQGLVPIDLATRAGRYVLTLRARTADGRELTHDHRITVATRTFPTRRITVEEKFATPPDDILPRIKREQAEAEAVFRRAPEERLWREPFVVPVPGKATSSFGRRSIVNGEPRSPHSGTDFEASAGTPVVAPNRGRVALAADHYFPGRTLIIDHGGGLYSYLAHLSEFDVGEGEMVERGQQIALSGATGRVTGPHLHWTMRLGRARVDPLSLVSVLESDRP